MEKARETLRKDYEAKADKIQEENSEINKIRFKMATSETQLFMILRELLSYDIRGKCLDLTNLVSEKYFEGDFLAQNQS